MAHAAPNTLLEAELSDESKSDADVSHQLSQHDRSESDTPAAEEHDEEKGASDGHDGTAADDDTNEQGEPYISGWPLVALLIAMVTTVFIVALSNTIISTAIPRITEVFNSNSDIGWYTTGEALTATAFQLPFGRAYTLLNLKWTFLLSLLVYLLGSLVCGVAQNSVTLIVGRAIAGIGNAGVFAGVFIIISRNVALRKRALYAGLVGATFAIAAVLGPILGGVFTDKISWRWCFYINLPIGAVSVLIIIFLLPSRPGEKAGELVGLTWGQFILKFNPFGALLLLGSLVCMFLALQWGGGQYAWSDVRVIATLVLFVLSFVAWLVLQYFQGEEATLPYSIMKERTTFGATFYTLLLSAALGLVIYYLPIWYQAVRGDSALSAGLKQLGIVISLTISSIGAGGLVVKIGYYNPFVYGGTILCSIGTGLLYTTYVDINQWNIIGYSIIFAAGIGMSLEQGNVAVQTVLPDAQIPAGTSLILFSRLLGSAIAGPIGQSVLQQSFARRLGQELAASIYGEGGATLVRSRIIETFGEGTPAARDALAAFSDSVVKIFMAGVIVSCLSALTCPLFAWKSVKKEKRENEDRKEGKVVPKHGAEGASEQKV